MSTFNTQAIVLRRVPFGDFDLVVTLLTVTHGKIAVMAKAAKKSVKRFAGVLEPFAPIQAVCYQGKGLPFLQEASVDQSLANVRSDVGLTAYASFWSEIVDIHLEDNHRQPDLYRLLLFVLIGLDDGRISPQMWSILFIMRFLRLAGLVPQLDRCVDCQTDALQAEELHFDPTRGGIICERCCSGTAGRIRLMKGTIKQLLWIGNKTLAQATRTKFSPQALNEALTMLESFVCYHLARTPKSLKFLKDIRRESARMVMG
jgi:DNA repair protein RecO (recombination protein O)